MPPARILCFGTGSPVPEPQGHETPEAPDYVCLKEWSKLSSKFCIRRQNQMDRVITTKAPVILADNLLLRNAHTSSKLGLSSQRTEDD